MLLFAIPFLVTFIFYLLTLCRTVYTGDSGELTLDCFVLGIAHPPGYPLLTLLGRGFLTLVPLNPAFALNILSALFAAAGVGAAALVIRLILVEPDQRNSNLGLAIPMILAIFFGFSNSLWSTAVGMEVYSFGLLLILLSLFMLLKFNEKRHSSLLIASGYFAFLGLANHLTITVMFIPILLFLIINKAPLRIWGLLFVLLILAVSAYLYIPIRSSLNPIGDWNHPANLKAFIDHVTARRYRAYVSGLRFDNYFENMWRSVRILSEQLPLYLGLVGLFGLLIPRIISTRISEVVLQKPALAGVHRCEALGLGEC